MTIGEAAGEVRNFCLKEVNGRFQLKNDYMLQVQGQLLVTGAPFCDFVVFTRRDINVERIFPAKPVMLKVLLKASEFFYAHARNYLFC